MFTEIPDQRNSLDLAEVRFSGAITMHPVHPSFRRVVSHLTENPTVKLVDQVMVVQFAEMRADLANPVELHLGHEPQDLREDGFWEVVVERDRSWLDSPSDREGQCSQARLEVDGLRDSFWIIHRVQLLDHVWG